VVLVDFADEARARRRERRRVTAKNLREQVIADRRLRRAYHRSRPSTRDLLEELDDDE